MKRINLTQGKFTIVDDEDYDILSRYSWYATKGRDNQNYCAARQIRISKNRQKQIYMHRFIMNPPEGMQVDHINCDPLDNRKSNLRICSSRQNSFNRSIGKNNSSGFKGVVRNRNQWLAQIEVNGKGIHLGRFDKIQEAAEAYNQAAKKYFGEYARVN